MKSDIVSAAVSSILTQSGLGENFRKDFEKVVAEVYDAGHDVSATIVESVPLTSAEIDAFRTFARSAKQYRRPLPDLQP